MGWFVKNKKGLMWGFIVGVAIAPAISVFGLVSYFIEFLRPILIGPMDYVNYQLFPNSDNEWPFLLSFIFNGICYSIFFGFIQSIVKYIKTRNIS